MNDEHTASPQPEPSTASAHRSPGIRFRTAAASSVLAAVTVTGIGVPAAQAREVESSTFSAPAGNRADTTAAVSTADVVAAVRVPTGEERLAGVRRDLANAVSWGSVTADQAERFYAQIGSRIARGL